MRLHASHARRPAPARAKSEWRRSVAGPTGCCSTAVISLSTAPASVRSAAALSSGNKDSAHASTPARGRLAEANAPVYAGQFTTCLGWLMRSEG